MKVLFFYLTTVEVVKPFENFYRDLCESVCVSVHFSNVVGNDGAKLDAKLYVISFIEESLSKD